MRTMRLTDCKVIFVDEDELMVCITSQDLKMSKPNSTSFDYIPNNTEETKPKGYFRIESNDVETLTKLLYTGQTFDAIVEMQKGQTSKLVRIL